ncbi:MarR family winged helix-turn-helix transcriptional regulator [Devosia sp.]|uniref:MarR family winged helix-turn-helix transcriptional regulator n=1 Tax=Devosia sp. TaxID=1871048 RepID=UPI003A8D9E07
MKLRKQSFRKQAPVAYLVFELSKLLKRRFEDEAKAKGLTLPQWRVLAHLLHESGISQSGLATATDTDPMTISGLLDRLEKRELVVRQPDPNDSRAKLVHLTEEGEELAIASQRFGLDMYDLAVRDIPAADREIATQVLTRMRDSLSGSTRGIEDDK